VQSLHKQNLHYIYIYPNYIHNWYCLSHLR